MDTTDTAILSVLILAAAALYSSVGHGGASAYLAAMGLYGLAPAVMKPTALCLNILVASIATFRFYRAGAFSWRLSWPFALGSIPFAFVGGFQVLSADLYRRIVGVVLAFAAYRLFTHSTAPGPPEARSVPAAVAILIGTGLGLLSGLVGVGGGIFLSPLILLMGWGDPRHTAGVSAPFIVVNSIAGLAGHLGRGGDLPPAVASWGVAAVAGGLIGSWIGSRKLTNPNLRKLLAAVLVVAAIKMIAA